MSETGFSKADTKSVSKQSDGGNTSAASAKPPAVANPPTATPDLFKNLASIDPGLSKMSLLSNAAMPAPSPSMMSTKSPLNSSLTLQKQFSRNSLVGVPKPAGRTPFNFTTAQLGDTPGGLPDLSKLKTPSESGFSLATPGP